MSPSLPKAPAGSAWRLPATLPTNPDLRNSRIRLVKSPIHLPLRYPWWLRLPTPEVPSPRPVSSPRVDDPAPPSLHRVQAKAVPLLHRYYEALRLLAARFAALRYPSFGDTLPALGFRSRCCTSAAASDLGLMTRYPHPGIYRERDDKISQVPGEP